MMGEACIARYCSYFNDVTIVAHLKYPSLLIDIAVPVKYDHYNDYAVDQNQKFLGLNRVLVYMTSWQSL